MPEIATPVHLQHLNILQCIYTLYKGNGNHNLSKTLQNEEWKCLVVQWCPPPRYRSEVLELLAHRSTSAALSSLLTRCATVVRPAHTLAYAGGRTAAAGHDKQTRELDRHQASEGSEIHNLRRVQRSSRSSGFQQYRRVTSAMQHDVSTERQLQRGGG